MNKPLVINELVVSSSEVESYNAAIGFSAAIKLTAGPLQQDEPVENLL